VDHGGYLRLGSLHFLTDAYNKSFWHPKALSYYYGYAWWGMSIPGDRLGRVV
jgi:hypothetical protein